MIYSYFFDSSPVEGEFYKRCHNKRNVRERSEMEFVRGRDSGWKRKIISEAPKC